MPAYESETPDVVIVANNDDIAQWSDEEGILMFYSAYKLAFMGDFDMNGFANTVSPVAGFLLFIFVTMIVNVIGLNSLIAILGES